MPFKQTASPSGSYAERSNKTSLTTRKREDTGINLVNDHEGPSSSDLAGLMFQESDGEHIQPKLWGGAYTSLVILCAFSVFGVLIVSLPVLPKAFSSDKTTAIICDAIVSAFCLFALVAITSLLRNKEKLHKSGLVLWPHSCQRCYHVFKYLHNHSRTLLPTSTRHFAKSIEASVDNREYLLPINKSPLYLMYIFGTVVISFRTFNFFASIICTVIDDSQHEFHTQEKTDIAFNILIDLYVIVTVFIVNFRFVPNFFNAHMIGIPKLRWSVVLITGVSVWIAVLSVTSPFASLTDNNNTDNISSSHCILYDIMQGAEDLSEPFSVELPIMIASFMLELWSRFLPCYIHGLTNQSFENWPEDHKNIQSNSRSLLSCWKRCLKDDPEKQPLLRAKYETNYQELVIIGNNESNLKQDPTSDSNSQNFDATPASNALLNSRNSKSKANSPKWLELSIAVMLVLSGLYFGISNLFVVKYIADLFDGMNSGLYLQLLAKMIFFTPELVLVFKQRRMTRQADGSYKARLDLAAGDYGNDKIFIFLMSGSVLFNIFCIVCGMGILIETPLLPFDIFIHVLSVIASVFGIFRMCTEAVFLLCVHRQHIETDSERDWTLRCLLYMSMANVAQWLYDTIIYETTSPVAWPELVTFFEGQVGNVAGVSLVPFFHLYTLHVAIFAFEVFKRVQYGG